MTNEKKPLFELSARELDEELSAMFAPYRESHPIRCEVGSALMAAEGAAQRICLRVVAPQADAGLDGKSHDALERLFNNLEALSGYLLDGRPSRIDLVLWDAAGYINGWFLDDSGRADVQQESCPEAVAGLASMLQALARYDNDWRVVLEQRAARLASLVRLAREKAEIEARRRVQSQGRLKKVTSPTTLERELLSLGFR
ncbi:hypothetical protein PFF91_28850 [Burkholderia cenocepacia]|uniref:hypothetical protein n=1 Tax=Burkholderia cenocepacia TaxID=95486 RepID=UPI0022EBA1BF|nr:hypothetical protein [Burkholderia cenocepacia]MDA3670010.1 hypothetical protein [Burkholderia cenocepacia]MDA3679735.1 hypothetical protein [Burkholderia cenocepacia]MDA3687572.1 hypothetical protein [Burkholderia cenocepacia]MDA3695025.1 hypothetical protein [Burkholderia cenocepacia]MDA3701920.1 hypothetical protein [Burkholderia cenocepacia]